MPARTPDTTSARTRALRFASAVLFATAALGACSERASAPTDTAPTLQHVSHETPATAHDGHPEVLPADAPLSGESIYHLGSTWTDHRGEPLVLADLRGHPVVVVMIYTSCETACPILVRDVLRLDAELPDDVRDDVRMLLVTFDTENDAPDRLARYVEENGLEDPRWRFAVGTDHGTRALAALLGVRYRASANGMFSHSNLITVLDEGGVPVARVEGLGRPTGPLVDAVRSAAVGE